MNRKLELLHQAMWMALPALLTGNSKVNNYGYLTLMILLHELQHTSNEELASHLVKDPTDGMTG